MGHGLTREEVSEKISVTPEGESELMSVSATDESPALPPASPTVRQQFVAFGREIESARS